MRKVMIWACFCTISLLIIAGCVSTKEDDVTLSAKIDFEKKGNAISYCSSIVSQNTITISHIFKEKNDNETIILSFSGNNIKKLTENCYSMNYRISVRIPMASNSNGQKSVQYIDEGSTSSLNIKLGQPVYIFENETYKIKLTVDATK